MKKYVKSVLLFFVAFILLILLTRFAINYTNLLNSEDIQFYDYNEKYLEEISVYDSEQTEVTFDYPSDWIFESSQTDNGVTVETVSLDNNDSIQISYKKADDKYIDMPIEKIATDSYSQTKTEYLDNGYQILDEGVMYQQTEEMYFLKMQKGKKYYSRFSWLNSKNYLCDMVLIYDKSKKDSYSLVVDTIHFNNPDNYTNYKSDYTSLTFKYPNTFVALGEVLDSEKRTITENFVKDEDSSFFISLKKVDVTNENDFYNLVVKPYNTQYIESFENDGYNLFSQGYINVNGHNCAYYYLRNDNNFVSVYYWFEKVNSEYIGGQGVVRYEPSDSHAFNSILRTIQFAPADY